MREELEQEIQEVRGELQGRLTELEPLPEALHHSELQLKEARDRRRSQERRHQELHSTLTELRTKVLKSSCFIPTHESPHVSFSPTKHLTKKKAYFNTSTTSRTFSLKRAENRNKLNKS